MGHGIRLVTPGERRARLALRHHLAPEAPAEGPAGVAHGLVALHGTDPASVYLAVWARTARADVAAVEDALYGRRVLLRMLGMRRTMYVVPTALAPVIQAGCTDEIAHRLRRRLIQQIEQSDVAADGAGWLKEVTEATVAALAARGAATGAELARDEPRLRAQVGVAAGKSYGGPVNITSRVLMLLSAQGRIVRGRPRGRWTSSQFQWCLPSAWLPEGAAGPQGAGSPGAGSRDAGPQGAGSPGAGSPGAGSPGAGTPAAARAELARRWLQTFGPAAVSDLQWWTGWTLGQVRSALAQVPTVAVDLSGMPGIMLAGDEEPPPPVAPWAALLPALDSTGMGWRHRDFYLGELGPALFDRTGNIGPTVWWDGQIVGGWAQRADGEVVVRLLTDAGAQAAEAVQAQAERLQRWLGPARITPRFHTPLERELSA
jgi:winged helix DNA-binding protein